MFRKCTNHSNTSTGGKYPARYNGNKSLESSTDQFKLEDIMRLTTGKSQKQAVDHPSLRSSNQSWMSCGMIVQTNLFDKHITGLCHTKTF